MWGERILHSVRFQTAYDGRRKRKKNRHANDP